ncbi:MAG: VWA domain-containing protein [Deltaproteobacteria bacterium]|nr:VWA domain-containing protein [Deltaproteobacteria bacterium]
MRKQLWGIMVLVAATSLALPLVAQDQLEAPFTDEVNVTEVLLDVQVNDKGGNVIIGLDKTDFIVEEDGKPIEIDSLTFYSNRVLETPAEDLRAKGVSLDEVPQDRYFIVLFEDQLSRAADAPRLVSRQLDAGRQTKEWIRSELLPGDWVAILSYDFKLKLHQDFSQDRSDLMAAVDRAVRSKDAGNWPSRIANDGAPSLATGMPQGKELRKETKRIYDALQVLARAAGKVQGRKNLLFFSLGFGDLDSFGQYRPDPRYYPPTMRNLNDNNVAVYTIDITPSGTRHAMEDALSHLALDTGGEYLFNFTSFLTPLRRASEANNGYYLISYQAKHEPRKSGYQKVKVATRNPEFKVRARSGYLYGN